MARALNQVEIPINNFCVIRPAPAKGHGIFAHCDIHPGTCIISDPPMLKLPGAVMEPWELEAREIRALSLHISEELKNVTKRQQAQFFSLSNTYKTGLGVFLGIAATNAMIIDFSTKECGIFPNAARINHACRPNAMAIYHPDFNEVVVHVVKEVSKGEEITISYIELTQVFSVRQEELRSKFGFSCICNLCMLSVNERAVSDIRRSAMRTLLNHIREEPVIMNEPLACLHNAHTAMLLQKEEGLLEVLAWMFYYDPLLITMTHGDRARARVFAEMAKAASIVSYGMDHPIALGANFLVDDPAGFGLSEKTALWKLSVDEIPRDLSKEDFETWLWKRDE
ncbi:hypothetical protein PRK78_004309 [Emydomyces testavorans]|uniref:SET domain-containing protein n=1 Tax=Emydomyces testavorans TaxID=2070801 RepID=A0AAF0IJM9_9EURO|nr:hypothetical protein PRK78_004309 [Emydomyces testavorans]